MLGPVCNKIIWNIVCKLQNGICGEKINKKEKVKIKTQNEKIVEADMDIWYYTYKKQLLVSGRSSAM